jgi:hypothetical protein
MDYAVASAWCHVRDLLFFLLSYDIMCQWSKNIRERLLKLPPGLRFQLIQYFVKYVIPKLHILGHLRKCQEFFSLLYILGSAQADMEGIERIWSSSGLMGASTREMGPGSHQDTLDDFWHHWNWNKIVGMGESGVFAPIFIQKNTDRDSRSDASEAASPGDKRAGATERWPCRVLPSSGGAGSCLEEGSG